MTVVFLLCLLLISVQVDFAASTDIRNIRKFCAAQNSPEQPLHFFLASNIGSRKAALQRFVYKEIS